MEPEIETPPRRWPCLPCRRPGQRHLMVVLLMSGMMIVFTNRVNLSVALVVMVNQTYSQLVAEEHFGRSLPNSSSIAYPSCEYKLNSTRDGAKVIHPWIRPHRKTEGEFKWSRQTQGLLLSSYFWGYAFPLIPAASIAHRWNAKWMFAFGVMTPSALAMLIPIAARIGLYCLLAVRVLQGICESVTCPSLGVLLGRWTPFSEATLLFVLAAIGCLFGVMFGQVTAGVICDSAFLGGWPSVFYLQPILCVAWIIPWAIIATNYPFQNRWITPAEVARIGTRPDHENKESEPIPWRRILSDRAVWAYIMCMGTRDWLFNTGLACLPQFLTDVLNLSIFQTGYISAIPYFSNLICPLLFALLADHIMQDSRFSRTITRKLFTLVGFGGSAVCLFFATKVGCRVWPIVGLMITSNVVISLVSGGFLPNAVDLSKHYCGVLFSMSNILSTIACILSPIVADLLAIRGTLKEWAVVFNIGCTFALVSGIFFLICGSGDRRAWDPVDDDDGDALENAENEDSPLAESGESINYGRVST